MPPCTLRPLPPTCPGRAANSTGGRRLGPRGGNPVAEYAGNNPLRRLHPAPAAGVPGPCCGVKTSGVGEARRSAPSGRLPGPLIQPRVCPPTPKAEFRPRERRRDGEGRPPAPRCQGSGAVPPPPKPPARLWRAGNLGRGRALFCGRRSLLLPGGGACGRRTAFGKPALYTSILKERRGAKKRKNPHEAGRCSRPGFGRRGPSSRRPTVISVTFSTKPRMN